MTASTGSPGLATLPHPGPPEAARILCVDDDPRVLEGLHRALGLEFEVVTADDPVAALRLLERTGDFEVVLSDLRMPRIEGTRFLAEAKRILPDATRLLLTGAPDLHAAIAAINESNVFRFLTKPCPSDQLLDAVRAAVRQHRAALGDATNPEGLDRSGSVTLLQPVAHAPALPAGVVSRVGHFARLGDMAELALAAQRPRDAVRALGPALRALLLDAQQGKATNAADTERAVVLAFRLAAATRDGTWIEYAFLLFGALQRVLPGAAIDQLEVALKQVKPTKPDALELYLDVLDLQGRPHSSTERSLLKRLLECRPAVAARK